MKRVLIAMSLPFLMIALFVLLCLAKRERGIGDVIKERAWLQMTKGNNPKRKQQ